MNLQIVTNLAAEGLCILRQPHFIVITFDIILASSGQTEKSFAQP